MSLPVPQPVPENVDANSQPSAVGSKPIFLYKRLLNEYAQKLRKQPPIYQTQNEGSDHEPKFRSTVWFDGASYPSSNTFNQLKMAETDASKNAYLGITQKLKNEALQLIREDKIYCKSVMSDYVAKMNIGRPIYETSQQVTSVPVFQSTLVFNGVNYPGDYGKSKKEAEQLAARGLILKFLDSEFANDMVDIIISKFKQMAEMTKVHEINNSTNVVEASMGPIPPPVPVVTQPQIPEASMVTITPAVHVVTRPHIQKTAPVVTQPCIPEGSVASMAQTAPVVSRQHLEISFMEIMAPVRGPEVLTQTPSVQSAPYLGQMVSNPSTDLSLEYIPLTTSQTSEKKRNRKNKENGQKKMRVDSQMPIPMIPGSRFALFSSQ